MSKFYFTLCGVQPDSMQQAVELIKNSLDSSWHHCIKTSENTIIWEDKEEIAGVIIFYRISKLCVGQKLLLEIDSDTDQVRPFPSISSAQSTFF